MMINPEYSAFGGSVEMHPNAPDRRRRALLSAVLPLGGCAVARITPDAARLRGIRTIAVPTVAMAREALAPIWSTTGFTSLN